MEKKALEDLGLTKEQADAVYDLHHGEMAPFKEKLKKAEDDLKLANDKVAEVDGKLKDLEGLDRAGYAEEIKKLKGELKQKETDHAKALSDRDFEDDLKGAISEAKGRNQKAIRALLDIEALKASKNRKEDTAAALRKLAESEDSGMLFGELGAKEVGTGDFPGKVTRTPGGTEDTAMRTAMGLPPAPETTKK